MQRAGPRRCGSRGWNSQHGIESSRPSTWRRRCRLRTPPDTALALARSARAGPTHPHRHRRLAPAGQWRGPHDGARVGEPAGPRRRSGVPDARRLPQRADAHLPRHQAGADHAGANPPAHRSRRRRPCPHRHRRPARAAGAAGLPEEAPALHDQLPHEVSGISQRAAAGAREPDLCLAAPLPQLRRRDAGGDAVACRPTSPPRASPSSGRGPVASTPSISTRRIAPISACRGRCSSMSAASRSRRTCAPSSTSTCRAARWWSATARRSPISSRATPAPPSWASTPVPSWRASTLRRTCSCFPSRTDTFGIVLLEALASGVPVAAYPVTGPIDVRWRRRRRRPVRGFARGSAGGAQRRPGGRAPEGARLQLGRLRGAFPEACSSGSRGPAR